MGRKGVPRTAAMEAPECIKHAGNDMGFGEITNARFQVDAMTGQSIKECLFPSGYKGESGTARKSYAVKTEHKVKLAL